MSEAIYRFPGDEPESTRSTSTAVPPDERPIGCSRTGRTDRNAIMAENFGR